MLTRKALAQFNKLANIDASRSVIEAALNNMCKANQRAAKLPRGEAFQFSENMQYFIMYVLGILKSQIISVPMIINQTDAVDKVVFAKYLVNQMSPDEILPLFSPQIISISNQQLNAEEYPPLEVLERQSIRSDTIYLLYNCMTIYLYLGRQCDPWFLHEMFGVQDIRQVDKATSEDEMFAAIEQSGYMNNLYNIINQIRYQRQPFCEI